MMIANGTFVFALNFIYSINLKTEALIMAGKWDPNSDRDLPIKQKLAQSSDDLEWNHPF